MTILILSLIGVLWLLLPLKVSGIYFYYIELMMFFSTLFIYHKKNNISYIILPSDIIKFIEFCSFFVFVVDEKWLIRKSKKDPCLLNNYIMSQLLLIFSIFIVSSIIFESRIVVHSKEGKKSTFMVLILGNLFLSFKFEIH